MYGAYFNFSSMPFSNTVDPHSVYPSYSFTAAYNALRLGLANGTPRLFLSGPCGIGKTTLLARLEREAGTDQSFHWLSAANIAATISSLLEGSTADSGSSKTVLLLDDPSDVPFDALERLFEVCGDGAAGTHSVQLIVAAQPAWVERLNTPLRTQLESDFDVHCTVGPLRHEEVSGYIEHKLRDVQHEHGELFAADALAVIAEQCEGIPRRVNTLCGMALLVAFDHGLKVISSEIVLEAASDLGNLDAEAPTLSRELDTEPGDNETWIRNLANSGRSSGASLIARAFGTVRPSSRRRSTPIAKASPSEFDDMAPTRYVERDWLSVKIGLVAVLALLALAAWVVTLVDSDLVGEPQETALQPIAQLRDQLASAEQARDIAQARAAAAEEAARLRILELEREQQQVRAKLAKVQTTLEATRAASESTNTLAATAPRVAPIFLPPQPADGMPVSSASSPGVDVSTPAHANAESKLATDKEVIASEEKALLSSALASVDDNAPANVIETSVAVVNDTAKLKSHGATPPAQARKPDMLVSESTADSIDIAATISALDGDTTVTKQNAKPTSGGDGANRDEAQSVATAATGAEAPAKTVRQPITTTSPETSAKTGPPQVVTTATSADTSAKTTRAPVVTTTASADTSAKTTRAPVATATASADTSAKTTRAPVATATASADTSAKTTRAPVVTTTASADTSAKTTRAPVATATTSADTSAKTTRAPVATATTSADTSAKTTRAPVATTTTIAEASATLTPAPARGDVMADGNAATGEREALTPTEESPAPLSTATSAGRNAIIVETRDTTLDSPSVATIESTAPSVTSSSANDGAASVETRDTIVALATPTMAATDSVGTKALPTATVEVEDRATETTKEQRTTSDRGSALASDSSLTPTMGVDGRTTVTAIEQGTTSGRYSVIAGDSLYAIAKRFDVTIDSLRNWNDLKSDRLSIGQQLTLHARAAPRQRIHKAAAIEPKQEQSQQRDPGRLLQAAAAGRTRDVRTELAANADVDAVDEKGKTALMRAAIGNHADVVQLLIERGADINRQDRSNGNTALSYAAWTGNVTTLMRLLDHGANVDAKNRQGHTALMDASINGHAPCVRILLDKRADVNARARNARTPLSAAVWNGHIEVARMLLGAQAKVDVASSNGWTPLMDAASNGNVAMVELLLEHGANPSRKTRDGATPAKVAARHGHRDLAAMLTRSSAGTS